MTIQDFIKQGHKWIELKGVPVRDSHSKSIVFIHNYFFEGKELDFQNELISNFMKLCPTKEWSWRVYGGDTPDADMVGWIYTQTAEIVSGDESVMPASEITEAEDIKVGDRVWCKHGEVMGTVTAIRIWNPDYAFKVRLDKPVTLFGRTFEETEFRRAGITKNYDRDGMIVGNAQYYAEQLKYGPASIIEYELAGVALRTESTREDVEPDSREGWGDEYRVTIHHQTGDTTEPMTLRETAELLARMYQEEQGDAA